MTFGQILVLVIIVCVTVVECVVSLAKASVMKTQTGVPGDREVSKNVVGALIEAEHSGATVTIRFSETGTEIVFIPRETEDEPVSDGD